MINKKIVLKKVSLILLSVCLLFLCLEIGTRLLWDHTGRRTTVEGNLPDSDKKIIYKTNSFSIRNREIKHEKPRDTKRILAIGDSFVWGDDLPEEELITVKLEQALQTRTSQTIDVINAGMIGYNTADELKQLKRLYPVYKPDLVILFFFTDDVLERTASDNQKATPPQIVNWKQNVKETLRNNSRFIAYLYFLYKSKGASKIGVPKMMLPSDYFDLDDTKPGWVAFKNDIYHMQHYLHEKDIEFVFVMIPTLTTLNYNYPYHELRNKVTELIKSNNIHFIDLFELFAPYQPLDLWVSQGNNHWNGQGTTIAAGEIVDYITTFKLLDY